MSRLNEFFKHGGRLVTVVSLLVITYCFAMFQGGFVSWYLFFTLLPFVIYAILLAIMPIKITEISRTLSKERVERGDNIVVTVKFRNASWFPIIFLTVRELPMDSRFYEAANGHSSKLFLVGWKREFEWSYELKQLKRGEHHFQGMVVTCTDFFGWTIRKVKVEKPQMFFVYPKVYPVTTVPLKMQYDQGTTASLYSLIKDTTMVTGVREYVPGDRFSWIHWKSFAKNGELRTKEFEDKQSQNIFFLIDRSVQRNFEQVVDFTASSIRTIVKERGDVSLLSVGMDRYFAPVIKTESQFEKMMQHLVSIQSDAQFGVDKLLLEDQKLMMRSVIVIVTGELTPNLKELLNSSSNYAKKIICFVIGNETDSAPFHHNNQVIFMKPKSEEQEVAEVNVS
ncbi:DUF58 domain-containing protein [Solibacillus sp. FSL K6-1523]|uniref:DUF58 domain-containing protein n=1 Tax=Solibacillus sp. FSL K6-1523 TaxID=2921471 RepID=UPI0030FB5ABE